MSSDDDDDDDDKQYELEKVIRQGTAADERSKAYREAIANLPKAQRQRKDRLFYTKWKGYSEHEWLPRSDIKDTVAYETWADKK